MTGRFTDRFDVFDRDGCYFCGSDDGGAESMICRECRAHGHTDKEVAAKRLIASILRENREKQ